MATKDKIVEPIKVFKTQFDKHDRKFMNAGTAEFPIRKARKINGVLHVDETKDMFNMVEYIQSFRDSVDTEILLKRFMAGDQQAIEQFTHQYGDYLDISQIPDNFNDMMAKIQEGQNMFNKLPIEVKEKFGNNYEVFMNEVGSDSWMEKMGYEKPAEPVKEDSGTAPVAEE